VVSVPWRGFEGSRRVRFLVFIKPKSFQVWVSVPWRGFEGSRLQRSLNMVHRARRFQSPGGVLRVADQRWEQQRLERKRRKFQSPGGVLRVADWKCAALV
jgi:hypothetical protein